MFKHKKILIICTIFLVVCGIYSCQQNEPANLTPKFKNQKGLLKNGEEDKAIARISGKSIQLLLSQDELATAFSETFQEHNEGEAEVLSSYVMHDINSEEVPYLVFEAIKSDGNRLTIGLDLSQQGNSYKFVAGLGWKCEGSDCSSCEPIRSGLRVTGCRCADNEAGGGNGTCNHTSTGGGGWLPGFLGGLSAALLGLLGD